MPLMVRKLPMIRVIQQLLASVHALLKRSDQCQYRIHSMIWDIDYDLMNSIAPFFGRPLSLWT